MKKLIAVGLVALGIFVTASAFASMSSDNTSMYSMMSSNNMGSMTQMCQTMMNSVPEDVIIKATGQVAKVGKESKITVFVLDKKTNKPLDNAEVVLHIEKGAPMESMDKMTMMDMMEQMSTAENIGSGKYVMKFTPSEKGYYTMHTHVIPQGKSMMSMMNNHMDIGIIVK
ncbi:MAG: hypothetical protein FJ356_03415 [Thaumarchaeota archaeon]|nr:hypothetical protein [Nitrososphaerota archaeon]